ncbi:UDP-N-acetylmuramate--L-alanine ligase [bacterium (Candidatus Gribaldobacteria) CG02_land_8_20_14_3_00_41_15]|uniref:UDP-N-acetylmuramate--L-alanine ligase n=1 Tax=bacterium (Candidatus Gribaldobacteria) CG02_land_8_20_14_3_00_41_15 TaxID=2014270 RepID=A0A2M7DEB8_9BACT|nr:MAG: UDP-N-acetylmuramate--L-alanine ligase [bacterium (Candidatus Gribaldobacteria) CG02_land_8_20_14_3_00_41_15]
MKIHFIGIGGIAISALANIYQQKRHTVAGSDAEASEITEELNKQGIKVFIGHKAANVTKNIDLVIYSEAVPQNNPELKEARRLKIRCSSGAEALAELSRDYFTIAVSGMHGKSTTASMIAQILIKAGLDPTFVIGTKPGFRLGKGKYLVIEADDYQAKFLHYHPDILVLTNIEEEHMDFFKNFSHIKKVFTQYLRQVKNFIIANGDDTGVKKVLIFNFQFSIFKPKINFYSLKDADAEKLKKILQVPGKHNISNALASLNTGRLLGINDKITLQALSEYKGVWRRFEEFPFKIKNLKLKIISDYAHHPTEIAATLQALAEKYPKQKKWVVFQPHQYQRTFYLFDNFVKTLRQAKNKYGINKLIITDIYTVEGRESQTIKQKVSSQKLVKAINKKWAVYQPEASLANYLKTNVGQWQVAAILGAGSVYKAADQLIKVFHKLEIDEKNQKSKIKQ